MLRNFGTILTSQCFFTRWFWIYYVTHRPWIISRHTGGSPIDSESLSGRNVMEFCIFLLFFSLGGKVRGTGWEVLPSDPVTTTNFWMGLLQGTWGREMKFINKDCDCLYVFSFCYFLQLLRVGTRIWSVNE